MNERLIIEGGHPLQGLYRVQGNKNAALPLIAASLLSSEPVALHNVPRIVDVENLVRLLDTLNVKTDWEQSRLGIDPIRLEENELPADIVHRLRGAILLLGVLAPRVDLLTCSLPGGCPIGRRSFQVHWSVFRAAGFEVHQDPEKVVIRREREVDNPRVFLEEASVTATENALILFAGLDGGTVENPAREPHVQSLIEFLQLLGCSIEVDALAIHIRCGADRPGPQQFVVPGDYVDAGTLAIAAAVTGGEVAISGVTADDLLGVCPVLDRFGIHLTLAGESVWTVSVTPRSCPPQITAGVWPAFPDRPGQPGYRTGDPIGRTLPDSRLDVRGQDVLCRQAGQDGCFRHRVRSPQGTGRGPPSPAGNSPGVSRHPGGHGPRSRRTVCGRDDRNRTCRSDPPRLRKNRSAAGGTGGQYSLGLLIQFQCSSVPRFQRRSRDNTTARREPAVSPTPGNRSGRFIVSFAEQNLSISERILFEKSG